MSTAIWVTGLGLTTPLGIGVEATWRRLVEGDCAIGPIRHFDVQGQRVALGAEVDGITVDGVAWSRSSAMAALAAGEAMQQAGIDPATARVGLVVGGTTGGMFETERLLARLHADPHCEDALSEMLSHPLTATGDRLVERLGPFARVRAVSSACSSGAMAIVVAASWLLAGDVDVVVAGGSDGLCRLTLSGFNALGALDARPCRPFHRDRAGTSLGEGAGMLVLERAERARARRATPIAELAGWAAGSEAHHITSPAPSGEVVSALVARALGRAGLAAGDLDYVNAHGTGTPPNDAMEAAALAEALGPEIDRIPVSSSKAQIGHTLGAAGAIEAAITALVVQRRTLVPTVGLDDPDPAARLVHVPHRGREVPRVRAALSCAFGFGGMDAVLVFTPPRDGAAHALASPDAVVTGMAAIVGGRLVTGDACAALVDAPPGQAPGTDPTAALDPGRARRLDVSARLAVAVARGALDRVGPEGTAPADGETGIVLGSAFGSVDGSAAFMHRILERGPRAASPADFPNLVPSAPVGHASIYLGLRGPSMATADLGVSGEGAFAHAVELVRAGEARRMVAGVVDPRSEIAERTLAAIFHPGAAEHAGLDRDHVAAAVVIEARGPGGPDQRRALACVVRVCEWRGQGVARFEGLAAPRGPHSEVVVARLDADVEDALRATAWAGSPRVVCSPPLLESDGLGGVALAIAVARIARAPSTEALVLGLAPGRGFAIVLGPP